MSTAPAPDPPKYRDRLADFRNTLATMKNGEMRTATGIPLQDQISAIEILDPRTDSNCGYDGVPSFEALVKSQKCFEGELGPEDMQSVLERLLMLEKQWCAGASLPQTLFRFIYMIKLDALAKANPILHAYCRGLLNYVHINLVVIERAQVREEDEFPLFGSDFVSEENTDEIINGLQNAIDELKQRGWDACAAHFSYRLILLMCCVEIRKGPLNTAAVAAILPGAYDALKQIRSDALKTTRTEKCEALFSDMAMRWWDSLTPLSTLPEIPLQEVFDYNTKVVRDLLLICEAIPKVRNSFIDLVHFVIDFSYKAPCLIVRSHLMLLAYDGETQCILQNKPIQDLLLDTFEESYGFPTLRLVVTEDESALSAIANYKVLKIKEVQKYHPNEPPPPPEITDPAALQKVITMRVRIWLERLSETLLHMLFACLNNRARFRRRLANLFIQLGELQRFAWDIDTGLFCGGFFCMEHTVATYNGSQIDPSACDQCRASSMTLVLSSFVSDIALRCQMEFLILGNELGLYAPEELPGVYVYSEHVLASTSENLYTLYCPNQSFLHGQKANKKRLFCPVALARRSGLPEAQALLRPEVLRPLLGLGVARLHALASRAKLVSVRATRNLTTPNVKFQHRFQCFQALAKPRLLGYEEVQRLEAALNSLSVQELVEGATHSFEKAQKQIEDIRSKVAPSTLNTDICNAWVSVAKANAVCTKLIGSLIEKDRAGDFSVNIEVLYGLSVYKLVRKPLPKTT